MKAIGVDLGGTKVMAALFTQEGEAKGIRQALLESRTGAAVADLVAAVCADLVAEYDLSADEEPIRIGVCVPGIANSKTQKVWAPNIPGWDNFPLKAHLEAAVPNALVEIESDRTCYILGESWMGLAKGCQNALFIAVGTGIGVGILVDGRVLHGASDIVGATGWMALQPPYSEEYTNAGCFETFASGTGIAAQARKLSGQPSSFPDAQHVFAAFERGNPTALRVLDKAVECWGMASANLVSLFNPEMVIWGGGVFGPAARLLDRIYYEACKWAQPISIRQCTFVQTSLPHQAGLYGAGKVAIQIQ